MIQQICKQNLYVATVYIGIFHTLINQPFIFYKQIQINALRLTSIRKHYLTTTFSLLNVWLLQPN